MGRAPWTHTKYLVERTKVTMKQWLEMNDKLVMTTCYSDNSSEIDIFQPHREHKGVLEIAARIKTSDKAVDAEIRATFENCYQKPLSAADIASLVRFELHAQQYS